MSTDHLNQLMDDLNKVCDKWDETKPKKRTSFSYDNIMTSFSYDNITRLLKDLGEACHRWDESTNFSNSLEGTIDNEVKLLEQNNDSDESKCIVCGDYVNIDEAIYCPSCETPYHSDCWDYNRGCGRYGCGSEILPAVVEENNSLELRNAETFFEHLWDDLAEFYFGTGTNDSSKYTRYIPLMAAALNPAAGLSLLVTQWTAILLNSYEKANPNEKEKKL